jgi:hypothetical protein
MQYFEKAYTDYISQNNQEAFTPYQISCLSYRVTTNMQESSIPDP